MVVEYRSFVIVMQYSILMECERERITVTFNHLTSHLNPIYQLFFILSKVACTLNSFCDYLVIKICDDRVKEMTVEDGVPKSILFPIDARANLPRDARLT